MAKLPAWYGMLCDRISWALAHGELDRAEAVRLVERWHPVALAQLGRQRQSAARIVGRGRHTRIVWPAHDPRLDDEQTILADLGALVAGGLAYLVPVDEVDGYDAGAA